MKTIARQIFIGIFALHAFSLQAQSENTRKYFRTRIGFPYKLDFYRIYYLMDKILLSATIRIVWYLTGVMATRLIDAGHHFNNNKSYNMQNHHVHVPWTTGPSIGYRITPYFNIRAEFKAHRNEVLQVGTSEPVVKYNTYTIGAGVFMNGTFS